MVSKTSFVVVMICFVATAAAWQDGGYDQVNSLLDILDRQFPQEGSVSPSFFNPSSTPSLPPD